MICLTFDTDHMVEASMQEFLHRFPLPGSGTFFCHRRFEVLSGLGHEIGPHPFIDRLSSWRTDFLSLASSLQGRAVGTRPHSCVFSHMVGVELKDMGYTYVSQASSLYETGLRPFRHPWGVWELPIYYMDNMDFWMSKNWPGFGHVPFSRDVIRTALADKESLFVFDIHPLHVALNTRGHEDYVAVKKRVLEHGVSPFDLAFDGRGARTFFKELCEEMSKHGVKSHTCTDALRHFGCLDAEGG